MICDRCGSSEFSWNGAVRICAYCRTPYTSRKAANGTGAIDSEIGIVDDIGRLLAKCRADPCNAKRYANLILDLDPSNIEALAYL